MWIKSLTNIFFLIWVLYLITHLIYSSYYLYNKHDKILDISTIFNTNILGAISTIMLILGLIYYTNVCVHAIYNTVRPISAIQLLEESAGKINLPIYGPSLQQTEGNTAVILLVHGAWHNPAHLKPIIDRIKQDYPNYDIATSLLYNHGGSLQDLIDFDYSKAKVNLLKDINYLTNLEANGTSKYSKVVCLLHSLGGLLGLDIASDETAYINNSNKINMIFYEPALISNPISLINKIGITVIGNLFDFCIASDQNFGFEIDSSIQYIYPCMPYTKNIIDAIYSNGSIILNRINLNKGSIKCPFTLVSNYNSNSVQSEAIENVLKQQEKLYSSECDAYTFKYSHVWHGNEAGLDQLFKNIDKSLKDWIK